jgi:hypothetical protein
MGVLHLKVGNDPSERSAAFSACDGGPATHLASPRPKTCAARGKPGISLGSRALSSAEVPVVPLYGERSLELSFVVASERAR